MEYNFIGIVYVFANKDSPENEIENLILSARVSSETANNNFIWKHVFSIKVSNMRKKNSENDMMAFTIDIELYMESSANMNHRHIFIKFSNEIERWILRNKLQLWNNAVKIPKQFKNVLQIFILYSVRTVYCEMNKLHCENLVFFFSLSFFGGIMTKVRSWSFSCSSHKRGLCEEFVCVRLSLSVFWLWLS